MLRLQGKAALTAQAVIWGRILQLPVAFFRRASEHQIAAWAQNIGALARQTMPIPPLLLSGGIGIVASFMFMAKLSLALTGWALALLAGCAAFPLFAAWRQNSLAKQQFACAVRNHIVLFYLFRDLPGLRLTRADRRLAERWQDGFAEEQKWQRQWLHWHQAADLFTTLAPLVSLTCLASLAEPGRHISMFLGGWMFTVSVSLSQRLLEAVVQGINGLPQAERVSPLLLTPLETSADAREIGPLQEIIDVQGLSFTYPGAQQPVLQDITLTICPGELVVLTGPSGSGKSTLLRLLLGFERPTAGEIRYDGQRLADIAQDAARRWMDAVFQDESLPPATIRSHIAGMSPHGLADVWRAAQLVGLEREIAALPMNMQTIVSSNKLSGSQTQRILIARALLHQPRLLFLDEATAGLDEAAQTRLLANLRALKITCILISHRPDAIALADQEYILAAGRIVQHHKS